jgi:hypothetical protein
VAAVVVEIDESQGKARRIERAFLREGAPR